MILSVRPVPGFKEKSGFLKKMLCLEQVFNVLLIPHVGRSDFLQADEVIYGRNPESDAPGRVLYER